jgi:UDP-N-acetylmuramyl pentapeptide phosphotransferase/UDP-N-acetylglucosamine-1-phosphate transferase
MVMVNKGLAAWVVLTLGIAVGVTWTVRRIAVARNHLDRPNGRSAHTRPTPRLGGIGTMLAFLPVAAVVTALGAPRAETFVVLGATAVISLLGFIDDLWSLPARVRFGVQIAAALAVVWTSAMNATDVWLLLPEECPAWFAAILSVLWIVWMTNLYNFMDGIDGLAGGQAVIGGVAVGVAAALGGAPEIALLALLLGAAALGFLRFNFPPASIFMGDVGSTAIGFFVASVPFLPSAGPVPIEVVGIAFAMFILDATVTLLRRMSRGERFFEAHRSHFYQRLLKYGVPHRTITLTAYAAMAVSGVAAVAYSQATIGVGVALVLVPVGIFVGLATAITRVERRHEAEAAGPAEQIDQAAA